MYKFGNIGQVSLLNTFIIRKDGKITINSRIQYERDKKIFYRVETSELTLIKKD